jgi:hypothetical protein
MLKALQLRSVQKIARPVTRLSGFSSWALQRFSGLIIIGAGCVLLSPLGFARSLVEHDNLIASLGSSSRPTLIVLISSAGDILQIATETSWDTLLLLVGLAFVAVAVLGNISGKISPGKNGRIAAALVGTILVGGGIWYHVVMHGFRVTGTMVAPPNGPFTGPCPLTLSLQGIVDASGSGNVVYNFQFSTGNASTLQNVNFDKTDSKIIGGIWQVQQSLTDAWVQLVVAAPQHKISLQSKPFSIVCTPSQVAATVPSAAAPPPAANAVAPTPTPSATPPPPPSTSDNSAVAAVTPKIPPHVVNDSIDSVALDSVHPAPGTNLKTGQPVPFNINVIYNLVSADSAILSVSTAQIRTSASACSSGSGELVDAVEVPIMRGKHIAAVHLTWSGDTGSATKGRIYGNGYLSFSPMFWASNNGARGARLDYFGIYGEYCYQFGP